MTDENRTWSRPVEEVIKTIGNVQNFDGDKFRNVLTDEEMGDIAEAAITRLISLGFINENGIEAMKAEKEAKT